VYPLINWNPDFSNLQEKRVKLQYFTEGRAMPFGSKDQEFWKIEYKQIGMPSAVILPQEILSVLGDPDPSQSFNSLTV